MHAVQQAARPAIATIPKVGSDLAIMNTYQIVSDQYTIVGTLGINMTIKVSAFVCICTERAARGSGVGAQGSKRVE